MTVQFQDLGSTTVEATRKGRPFYTLNQEGNWDQVGDVILTNYESNVQALALRTPNKAYTLGRTSNLYQVIDHRQVIQPLMDEGWVPAKIDNTRGGGRLFVSLTHPSIRFEDFVVPYDRSRYPSVPGDGTLALSLGIWSDARAGHGVRVTLGFWRFICANGMVSSVLRLGDRTFKSTMAGHASFLEWIQNQVSRPLSGEALGYKVTRPEALNWLVDTLRKDEADLLQLPDIIRTEALAVHRDLSQGVRQTLVGQIQDLRDTGELVSAGDLLNTITNTANFQPRAHSRLYHGQESLASNLARMMEVGALVNGTVFETKNYKVLA